MSKKITVLVLSMFMFVSSVFATKITWNTATAINSFWSEPLNWDLGRIPNATDSVMTFYSDVIVYTFNYSSEIKYMKLLGNLTIPLGSELIFTNGQFEALGTLTNYGTIRINNSPGVGLVCNTIASNRPFNNYGSIFINNAATKGLVISKNQVITNAAGGLIEITNSGAESMYLGYPFENGIMDNSGTLKIGVGGNGIGLKIDNSLSAFNNLACGKVILVDKLVMTGGTLNNSGFFKQDYDGDNDFGVVANTTLNNYGIIEDRYGSFDFYNAFDAQSIWIKFFENKQFKTGEKVPIFTVSSPVGINMGNVFTDSLLTQNAGTYNLNTNTWIPNQNANGKTKFFIRASQQSNSCFDTLRFDLELPILAVNYWIGGTGTWQTAAKWSNGTVPSPTEVVGIYNSADQVGINNSVFADKIFLGGKITVSATGILTVGRMTDETGIELEEGIIVNNGTINIINSAFGMNIRNGALINNSSIQCTNTTTCIYVNSAVLTASIDNTGTIVTGNGTLINGDETVINNSGSLFGYDPTYESINSDGLINTGVVYIEGDGINATGFNGDIKNMASGVITLKKLSTGGKFSGENSGMIITELCNRGFQINGIMTNLSGGEISASNNTIGMFVDDAFITNNSGGKITLSDNSLYGLQLKAPATFQTIDLVNEGVINITDNAGIGIYNGSDIRNQMNGIIRVRASGSHGIHLYRAGAELENFDQAKLDIKTSGGHGILSEGAFIYNRHTANISIDSVGMSGIYFGDYFTGFATLYAYMNNLSQLEIGPTVGANGIHLETGTYITNYECASEIISKSKIQLDGMLNNYGIYRHLTSATSSIGTNLVNKGVTYDPFASLTSPNTWNDGIYIGKKTGSFNEGQSISSMLEISPTIPTGFTVDTAWFLNRQLNLPGGIYNAAQNSMTPFGLAVDSSIFYFEVHNTNCIPARLDTFSLAMQSPINKVCGKIVWVGGKGTLSNAANWDRYRLPGICDSIMVDGLLDSVLVNTSTPLVVNHISNKGTLLLSPAADLTISGNAGNGLYNDGIIINKGSFTIKNISLNGYLGTANAQFTNEGTVLIKDITLRGMDCDGGFTENKAGATFTIQNSILDNLRLRAGAVFQQGGVLHLND